MSKRLTTEEFIKKAIKIHGNKYDYSKVNYVNNKTPVRIICSIHGEFLQKPSSHINKNSDCPKCAYKLRFLNRTLITKEFIQKAKEIHGIHKYDYSKVNYVNYFIPVIIICLKHGEFLQKPNNHLSNKQGCPICRSSKGEILIAKILKNLNINYERQKRFNDCVNLHTKCKLPYDFYIPQENMLIEFNGEQHYKTLKHWNKNGNTLETQQHRDILKKKYALANGYKFLVIKYDEDIEKVLKTNIHPF